jgi:transposase
VAEPLIHDELWRRIAPLLPPRRRGRCRRRPLPQRQAVAGVLFVVRGGVPWKGLPAELGPGRGRTCWRRLREWQFAPSWPELREALLGG